MTDLGEITALLGLASGDAQAALATTSDMAMSRGRSGDDGDRIVSIPADFDPPELEALGFTMLEDVPQDREAKTTSFVRVQMPEGWSIQSGSDIRIRDIVDERGVKRVTTSDNGQWWDRYVTTRLVRQGYEVPLRLCYGDGTLESVLWRKLTPEEQAEAVAGLHTYVKQGEESSIYADTSEKAQKWLDRIAALT